MKLFVNFRNVEDFKSLAEFNQAPITFFYDYIPQSINDLSINPYNIMMLHEPNQFFGYHTWVKNNAHLFTCIITWNEDILQSCSNSVLFTFNCRQDNDAYYNLFANSKKEFEVSFLSGNKQLTEGHKLRQEIYQLKDKINIPKKWFYVLDDFDTHTDVRPGYSNYSKSLNHIPDHLKTCPQVFGKRVCYEKPMFHVCVENVKEKNWYTEKIGEAFCTKTVPIYWGCPNIEEYYDKRGIITFNTKDELVEIVNSLTVEMYNNMKPYIDYNYQVAMLDSLENKIYTFFKEFITQNNL